ncbi:MAG: response regulator, partial [Bacteroidetes bacterium]|nr:response regulator [Bacteroidota bacterium]
MQTKSAIPLLSVLVVEDHESLQETLCDTLSDEGFDPVACGTGAEALALAEQSTFAVAIVDQKLPDIDGTTLLERLERVQPGIVSIIHTGYGSFASAKEAINRGAFAYIEKIGEEDDLMLHVHRAARAWTSAALQAAEVRHTRELEDRVRRRTEELAKANAELAVKNEDLKREIAVRKQAEAQIQQAEEKLRTTQEYLDTILLNLPVGVAILEGPDFRYYRINHRLAEINGLPVEDHLDRPLAAVLPDAAPDIIPGLRHVLETGEARLDREFSTRLPKDPAVIRYFIDSFFAIKGADGKPKAVGVVVLDI